MPFVYSTCSSDNVYVVWNKNAGQGRPAVAEKRITVKGKANIIDQKTMVTPDGAVTEVSAEDLAYLEANVHFQNHMKRGFMKVQKTRKSAEVSEVVADMTAKDASAQLTDKDFKDKKRKPKVAKAVPEDDEDY